MRGVACVTFFSESGDAKNREILSFLGDAAFHQPSSYPRRRVCQRRQRASASLTRKVGLFATRQLMAGGVVQSVTAGSPPRMHTLPKTYTSSPQRFTSGRIAPRQSGEAFGGEQSYDERCADNRGIGLFSARNHESLPHGRGRRACAQGRGPGPLPG